ncbi:hypothetical protein ACFFUC_12910 [Paracoccus cavernae]|uniref:hypothetical protein n=2 Tax=Paracoccus cavernae TaxID=1571207 RepID=UPI0035F22488
MSLTIKEKIIHWLAVAGGAALVAFAAKTPVTMLFFTILQVTGMAEATALPVLLGAMALLLIGFAFWMNKQSGPRMIAEYSTLAAGLLFCFAVLCIIGVTAYEFALDQQATDPGGPAMAVLLVALFSAVYLVLAAICFGIGLTLRRRRLSA